MADVRQDEPKFLTVDEFAKRIGVHPQTVRTWDNTGVLVAHHRTPKGRRLYSEEQVEEYFKSN
jgi:excisionase family DNA binding protein